MASKPSYCGEMLIKFLYLDRPALGQYISSLEGGSVQTSTTRSSHGGSFEGGGDLKVASAKGSRSHEEEVERALVDTESAQFKRLLAAAAEDPERLGWIEVLDPDADFEGVGIGAMVSWECDLFVPAAVKMISQAGGVAPLLDTMRAMLPAAKALGLKTGTMPADEELDAMGTMLRGFESSKVLIVGEDDATDWKVAGHLSGQVELGDLEGRARVVGKVARTLREGQWKPYMAFPGMDLLSREQRRLAERTPPAAGKEDDYIHGPALMLDILAVYR